MPHGCVVSCDNGSPQEEDVYQQYSTPLPPGVSRGDQYNGNVNYPPPGLIRATMPIPISECEYLRERRGQPCTLNDSQVSMFSDVVGYFDTGFDMYGNHIMCDLTCGICGDGKLEMPSCVSPRQSLEEVARTEPLCILPCGHFFGAWCMDAWISTCRDEDRISDCPLCRFPLHYDCCGHEIRIRHYDPRFTRAGQLPLTLPEGGCVPAYCKGCRVNYVKDMADRMAETVYPRDVPPGAFWDPNKFGPYEFRDMRALIRADMLDSFLRGEEAFSHW
ncbi:hypothetical protein F4781DRAFT_424740 [Annulohypoxylon bovei var. microspora]|nr:hypothetical protein F4781DRAFT_424740 [Annulohypoxylon bovei var. microspora]